MNLQTLSSLRLALGLLSTLGALATSGCAATPAEATASSADQLTVGEETYDDPHVGRLLVHGQGCTGTLIRRDVVLTAAHCVGYGDSANAGLSRNGEDSTFGSFTVSANAWTHASYAVDGYTSWGTDLGDYDIALVHLRSPVDAPFVRQVAGYGFEHIGNGTPLAQYGYGCTNRGNESEAPVKRRVSYVFGDQTGHGCPGDSGGPVLTGAHNVVLVASAYWTDSGLDIFGNVLAAHEWIEQTLARWS